MLNTVLPLKYNFSVYKKLLSLLKNQKKPLFGSLVLLAGSTGATMSVPYLLGKLIDTANMKNKREMRPRLKKISLGLLILFSVGGLANYGRIYLTQRVCQQIGHTLRCRLFSSTLKRDIPFFDTHASGNLVHCLSSDIDLISKILSQNVTTGLQSVIQATVAMSMMVAISPFLTFTTLSITLPFSLIWTVQGRHITKYSRMARNKLADITQFATERLSNIRLVKSFCNEGKEVDKFSSLSLYAYNLRMREAHARATFHGSTQFGGNVMVLSVFYFGALATIDTSLSVGDLASFLLYTAWTGFAISGISTFVTELLSGVGTSHKLFDLLESEAQESAMIDSSSKVNFAQHRLPENLALFESDVYLRNIRFSYPSRPQIPVLNGLNMDIRANSVTALVGSSGSGKSTVASLLLRLYEPDCGSITFNGVDVKNIALKTLREAITVVPQEPILFSGSIEDNLMYGREEFGYTLEDFENVTKQANAFDFIMNFPDKWMTKVGERGVSLSGGQKQRLVLARAFLRNPRFLILDEATSALDSESESLIQQSLSLLFKDRTVLVIAHRLSTIENADYVAVLRNGRIIEYGSFTELLRNKNGHFGKFMNRQVYNIEN